MKTTGTFEAPLPPRATLEVNGQGCGPDLRVTGELSRVLEIARWAYPSLPDHDAALKPSEKERASLRKEIAEALNQDAAKAKPMDPFLINCVDLADGGAIGRRIAEFLDNRGSGLHGKIPLELINVEKRT